MADRPTCPRCGSDKAPKIYENGCDVCLGYLPKRVYRPSAVAIFLAANDGWIGSGNKPPTQP